MKAISIPFSFSNGAIIETSDLEQITEQNIIDALVTSPGERAINVSYGADIKSLLYEPVDTLVFDDFKLDALNKLNEVLDSGTVIDITTSYADSSRMAFYEDSSLTVSVRYSLPLYGTNVFSININANS